MFVDGCVEFEVDGMCVYVCVCGNDYLFYGVGFDWFVVGVGCKFYVYC